MMRCSRAGWRPYRVGADRTTWPVRSGCSSPAARHTQPARSSTLTGGCTYRACEYGNPRARGANTTAVRRTGAGMTTHDPEVLLPEVLLIAGREVPVVTATTVVVGTGSAGFCAADRLWELGQSDVVMVTDKIGAGTSRNAGSDKQTYYKMSLSGDDSDIL